MYISRSLLIHTLTRAPGWVCVVPEHSCPGHLGCPPRGRGGGASSGMCIAVARKSRTFGVDMRTRVGSGDSLSQPWVARSGGGGGRGAAGRGGSMSFA